MNFKTFTRLIMIEQTLFALPFAWLGILFAGGGNWQVWIWSTTALFGARAAGMSFNRLLDADIDAKNPRTAERLIPTGQVSRVSVWILAVLASALLVFSAWMLNTLVFILSFLALVMLFTYSLFKRFSSTSHFYLGLVEAAAPIGGYLAVTGEFSWLALLPGVAILFWIAGIDILYSVQDVEFDREENLYSVPAKFGVANARRIASVSYLLAVVALVAAGYYTYMGLIYFVAVLSVSIIFSRQQWIAFKGEGDVEASMGKVFFLNRFISPVLFAGALADWLLRYFF